MSSADGRLRMVPNIFDYATKELSQDALICWLVACARHADGGLRELGIAFVSALMRAMRAGERSVIDVRKGATRPYEGHCELGRVTCGPKRQYRKIDVYFQAEVDGKKVSFVIEDKTHTKMHGDQLKRYRNVVADDGIEEDLVKAVYLKTGYVFDDEREQAESAGYAVFDAEDMRACLEGNAGAARHEIVRQFAEYLGRQLECRRKALAEWDMDQDFVQWEFMVRVRLSETLRLRGQKWPGRWFNIGGGAWTQYPYGADRGALFWRLDSGKPLRLMVDTRKAGERVLERWDKWSAAFEKARREAGLCPGKFRRVRRRSGAVVSEGTIGAIDIGRSLREEGRDRSVAKLEVLYRKFVELVDDELKARG